MQSAILEFCRSARHEESIVDEFVGTCQAQSARSKEGCFFSAVLYLVCSPVYTRCTGCLFERPVDEECPSTSPEAIRQAGWMMCNRARISQGSACTEPASLTNSEADWMGILLHVGESFDQDSSGWRLVVGQFLSVYFLKIGGFLYAQQTKTTTLTSVACSISPFTTADLCCRC